MPCQKSLIALGLSQDLSRPGNIGLEEKWYKGPSCDVSLSVSPVLFIGRDTTFSVALIAPPEFSTVSLLCSVSLRKLSSLCKFLERHELFLALVAPSV